MNSRSARNETMPNNKVAPTAPDIQASQNNTAPNHTARRSRAKRAWRCWAASPISRSDSANHAINATRSTPKTMTNSSATCSLTASVLSPIATRCVAASCARRPLCEYGGAGPLEEVAPVFAVDARQRCTERHRAQDRHRHHFTLGHHALHVVDPGRNQLHLWELRRQVVQAALERLRLGLRAARALGKD